MELHTTCRRANFGRSRSIAVECRPNLDPGWRHRCRDLHMTTVNVHAGSGAFFGWRVMWAAFIVAVFGWGVGFYGPPVFLHTLEHTRGWSIGLVSAAVTAHFLRRAPLCVANMPAIYRRFGVSAVTKASAVCVAVGIAGWANAQAPWQLFIATIFSGFGWAGTGALRHQHDDFPVVRSAEACGAVDGLQRRQYRRRRLFAAVGRAHRRRWLSRSGGARRRRDDRDAVGAVGSLSEAEARGRRHATGR